ncbi:polyketide cyclase [Streptomyces albofaciens JCM 4342]|uniref:SRPBCC family protein n=1 Tax=Streptomyces albofaciens TaxID=66866 RepID=UPI00123AC4B2|nr:SRPBCC family protein [Streptomyces albofaciens]KAA6223001.1 polyketide cyclase [Streptomyces albofaciens JCM 4342]
MPERLYALHRYRFRSEWRLSAPPTAVYAVLEDAETYPRWWPQVRRVVPVDERSGTASFRSLLPYVLTVTATAARRDPEAGILEIAMCGDLEGFARWTVGAAGGGTRAVFEQEVEVRKPSMRRLALPGRPFFVVNHSLMMRAGRRGLASWLARE